jgi:hypothetical protein
MKNNVLLDFDQMGIIPKPREDIDSYLTRSVLLLDSSNKVKQSINNQVPSFGPALNEFQQEFMTSPLWINCFYSGDGDYLLTKSSKGKKTFNITLGRTSTYPYFGKINFNASKEMHPLLEKLGISCEEDQSLPTGIVDLPLVTILPSALNPNQDEKATLKHEFIHTIRLPLEHKSLGSPFSIHQYAEAFAYSLTDHSKRLPKQKNISSFLDMIFASFFLGSSINYFIKNTPAVGGAYLAMGSLLLATNAPKIIRSKNADKMCKILDNLRTKEYSEQDRRDLNYSLLRMNGKEVFDFVKYSAKNDSPQNNIKNYIKSHAHDNLRLEIMAERLG